MRSDDHTYAEETVADPCVACNMPSDDKKFKGKSYCSHCYAQRLRREVQW